MSTVHERGAERSVATIYAMTLVLISALGAGHTLGLGSRWDRLPLVRSRSWLR